MKRVNLDDLIGMGGSEITAGSREEIKLDPVLENFLSGNKEGELKLPGEQEWKEGDQVVDPTIHPRDLQEMRANKKPAEHIEPISQEKSDEIYRNFRDTFGSSEIPNLHKILGWN